MRDSWSSASNSTLMPGDSGAIRTVKPGFGVAHKTSTPAAENEIAVLPPTRLKVSVSAGGAIVGDGAEVVVGARVVVEDVSVSVELAGGVVVGCTVVVEVSVAGWAGVASA